MLFYTFGNRRERKGASLSEFVEFQFCRRSSDDLRELFDLNHIVFRREDSLYVFWDDNRSFFREYGSVFGGGIHPDGERGLPDFCGLTHYDPSQVKTIQSKIVSQKPMGYETLSSWLKQAEAYNGFYILGI